MENWFYVDLYLAENFGNFGQFSGNFRRIGEAFAGIVSAFCLITNKDDEHEEDYKDDEGDEVMKMKMNMRMIEDEIDKGKGR